MSNHNKFREIWCTHPRTCRFQAGSSNSALVRLCPKAANDGIRRLCLGTSLSEPRITMPGEGSTVASQRA